MLVFFLLVGLMFTVRTRFFQIVHIKDWLSALLEMMWGIFEVFADTILICTMTALTILCSGVYDFAAYEACAINGTDLAEAGLLSGVALTGAAFESVFGVWGGKFISLLIIFIGCNASLQLVVDISDTFNGFMALPNLVAVTLLSGQVVQMTKDFIGRVKAGKETISGDDVA